MGAHGPHPRHEIVESQVSGVLHQATCLDHPGNARLEPVGVAGTNEEALVWDHQRIGREPGKIGIEPTVETRAERRLERHRAFALEAERLEKATPRERIGAWRLRRCDVGARTRPVDGGAEFETDRSVRGRAAIERQHHPAPMSDQQRTGADPESGAQEAAAVNLRSGKSWSGPPCFHRSHLARAARPKKRRPAMGRLQVFKASSKGPELSSVQNGTEVGGGGKGCPPGPAANVVHGFTGVCATPGLAQSHTPVGNTACNLFC
jgi:hypothetical protein